MIALFMCTLTSFNKNWYAQIYEQNLIEEGLELEYESQEEGVLHFIKVHAPLEVLRRYSEILKLRLPMKEVI